MKSRGPLFWAGLACVMLSAMSAAGAGQQDKASKDKDSDKHPRLTLTARPPISMSPARVALTADLVGGPDDAEDYYCPTVVWAWGDGTESETTADCEPYEAGKSTIKRHFTVEHVFRAGYYRVSLRLKKHDKAITSATVVVDVRPGIRDL